MAAIRAGVKHKMAAVRYWGQLKNAERFHIKHPPMTEAAVSEWVFPADITVMPPEAPLDPLR